MLGLVLFGATMLIFFTVYFFFSGVNYFETSMIANAFILPIFYAGVAFWSVKSEWNVRKLGFKDGFKRAFMPMFLGGFFSVISIFIFLNYVDTDAKDLLNYQFVQTNKNKLEQTYKEEIARLKDGKEKEQLEKDYQKSIQSFNTNQVKGNLGW